jgi:hypothetical protein
MRLVTALFPEFVDWRVYSISQDNRLRLCHASFGKQVSSKFVELGMNLTKMTSMACLIACLCPIGPAFSQDESDLGTREEWQARVDRARDRVEQIRKGGSFVYEDREVLREAIKERTNRALDDEDLRPGDFISTGGGFLRFEGISPDGKRVFSPVDGNGRKAVFQQRARRAPLSAAIIMALFFDAVGV